MRTKHFVAIVAYICGPLMATTVAHASSTGEEGISFHEPDWVTRSAIEALECTAVLTEDASRRPQTTSLATEIIGRETKSRLVNGRRTLERRCVGWSGGAPHTFAVAA